MDIHKWHHTLKGGRSLGWSDDVWVWQGSRGSKVHWQLFVCAIIICWDHVQLLGWLHCSWLYNCRMNHDCTAAADLCNWTIQTCRPSVCSILRLQPDMQQVCSAERCVYTTSSAIDNIWDVRLELRGEIFRTVYFCTDDSSYNSLDSVLSHWAHFTVHRFICAYRITASIVGWTWWDWSLILSTYLPSLLWHCWLGHLTRKNPSPIWPIMCLVEPCSTPPAALLHGLQHGTEQQMQAVLHSQLT